MMQLSNAIVSLALICASASAVPLLNKRIAQTIIDSVQPWENACDAANGGPQCNAIAVNASSALLAAADPCAQQDAGDIMVNTAKSLGNNPAMVVAAQIFVQQARNSPNSVAIPYCQHAPANPELNGLFQCQFEGVNENQFANGQALGGTGTIPFGMSAPVNPLGSCPAHPSGPITDGVQLSTLVTSPGTPATSSSGSASGSSSGSSSASNSTASSSSGSDPGSSNDAGDTNFPPPQQSGSSSSTSSAPSPVSSSSSSSSSGGFQLSNGQMAQQQNADFSQLTPSSSCTEGSQSCVKGDFAQCVGGQFTLMPCGATTQCFALPLVNKAGTSVTCTTEADAAARIAATGATGGVTGSGSSSAPASGSGTAPSSSSTATGSSDNSAAPPSAPASSSSSSSNGSFQLANGQAAQKANAAFASLTPDSSCTEGQDACIEGGFAQCVGGKFTITQCAGGTQCLALPLVNKAGTSIACTTESDAASRIAATGASGGITGSS